MFAEIRQLHALKTTALSNWYGAALPPLRHARRRRCSSASPQNRAHVVCSAGLLTGDSRTAVCRDVVITPTVSKGWEGPVRMDKYSDSQDEAAQVCRLTCRPPHKALQRRSPVGLRRCGSRAAALRSAAARLRRAPALRTNNPHLPAMLSSLRATARWQLQRRRPCSHPVSGCRTPMLLCTLQAATHGRCLECLVPARHASLPFILLPSLHPLHLTEQHLRALPRLRSGAPRAQPSPGLSHKSSYRCSSNLPR